MSATPQDFHLWSQLTGNPYPRTPAEQMYLAPHVRSFVQNIGRQGGYIPQQQSGLRRAIDFAGKTALAAGGLTLAALAGKHYLDNRPPSPPSSPGVEPDETKYSAPYPSTKTATSSAAEVSAPAPTVGVSSTQSPSLSVSGESGYPENYGQYQVKSPSRSGIEFGKIALLPASSEPATVRIARATVPSPAGPGPESLAGESSIQLGTPYETPVQRAEGQNDLTLYGQPKPGAVEAFRASKLYEQMKETYRGMHDIVSPTEPASTIHEQLPQTVRESRDVTPPTPGQRLNQGAIAPDIQALQAAKGSAPGTPSSEFIVSPAAAQARRVSRSQAMGIGGETLSPQDPDFHPGVERVRSMMRSGGHEITGDITSGEELHLFSPNIGRKIPISHPIAQDVLSRYGVSNEDAMAHRLHTFRSAGVDLAAEQARYQAEANPTQTAVTVPTPRVSTKQKVPAVPTGATVRSRPAGPSEQEARELMESLNRTHLHIPRNQREMLRDQILSEKYSQSPAPSPEATVQSGTISPKSFLEEKIGKSRGASMQATEAQRSQIPSMIIPAKDNEPGRIQFHREHGHVPPVKAGSSVAFGHQDEISRRLSALQNLGYDPNQAETPMWW